MGKFKFLLLHLISYLIVLSVVILLSNSTYTNGWYPFGIGVFNFVLAIIARFGLIKEKNINTIVSIIFSCIANGLLISSLCVATNTYITTPIDELLLIVLSYAIIGTLIYVVFYFLMNIQFLRKHFIISLIAYLILTFGLIIFLTINQESIYFGGLIIYNLISWFFLICYLKKSSDVSDMYNHMSIASMSTVVILIIIALIVLSEGDADVGGDLDLDLDLPDLDLPSSQEKNKKKDVGL